MARQERQLDGEPGAGECEGEAAHRLRVAGESVQDQCTTGVTGGGIGLGTGENGSSHERAISAGM